MLAYKCPRCKGTLKQDSQSFECAQCASVYPVVDGIADFRLYPDPYIDLEADRAKGLHLAEKARDLSFKELVDYYYSITPEVPADLAKHYTAHHVAGVVRGQGVLERIRHYGLIDKSYVPEMIMDLGCGTGGMLAAVGTAFGAATIGVDIAFRWLIVARKRLQELGCTNIELVCACADYLPFDHDIADLILAENLIEHVKDTETLFSEIERVRKTRSALIARTVNRYALGPEPHVGVWGVGYLPRALMNQYVQLVKKIPYEHIHLHSHGSLNLALRAAACKDLKVRRAALMPADYEHHAGWKKTVFKTFDRISRISGPAEPLFTTIGPYLDVTNAKALTFEQNTTSPELAAHHR